MNVRVPAVTAATANASDTITAAARGAFDLIESGVGAYAVKSPPPA